MTTHSGMFLGQYFGHKIQSGFIYLKDKNGVWELWGPSSHGNLFFRMWSKDLTFQRILR